MELTRDPDGTIVVRLPVEDHGVSFRAVDVRRERGKPRATVTIGQDDLLLDEDEFPLADRHADAAQGADATIAAFDILKPQHPSTPVRDRR